MRRVLVTGLAVVFMLLSALYAWQVRETGRYRELYKRELNNVEAYRMSSAAYGDAAREYRMTIGELRASKDSIDRKMLEMADELKLKDKRIQYLQYQRKTIERGDTLVLRDTVFEPWVNVDTVIGDEWYKLSLKLSYPSSIAVKPSFKSEQYVFVNTRKEYNRKPSRWFFVRWFQKRHEVVEVVVKEKNAYITNNEQKFIKVVKE